ncbi:MAG: BphX family protein [Saprospiraceae bacterium]|nr:BphX family protein [Saprospiraceae bacterium]MCB9325429.1 BphX family protein [Lewinellaceae bacterium]
MKKLQWWMRIVGVFYLLLTVMNLYGLFINPDFVRSGLPGTFNSDPLAVRSFMDAWMVFVFELGAIGAVLVYASKDPLANKSMVWLIILAELLRGVLCDAIWIKNGYDASGYIPFIIIHLIIIITGWIFLKNAEKMAIA